MYEQVSSEYIFVGAAVLLNKVSQSFRGDGSLDIAIIGFVHMLAFLFAFYRLLLATGPLARAAHLDTGVAGLTDVGYAAYWNSFYAEPASCIFFLCFWARASRSAASEVSSAQAVRWALWAVLFVMAKPQNAPLGILLALFVFRLRLGRIAIASSLVIVAAAVFVTVTSPVANMWSSTYDQVFMAILPESKILRGCASSGIDPDWLKYSGTGAWTPGHESLRRGEDRVIGKTITHGTIARFYRCGQPASGGMPSASCRSPFRCVPILRQLRTVRGRAAGGQEPSFDLWSRFHEHVLEAWARSS